MNFAKAAYIISLLSQLASVANGAGLRAPVKKVADTTASDASQTSNELSLDDTHFNLNDYDPEVYSELFHPLYKTFHNLTLAEQDAILDERDRNVKGYHRGLMVEHDHSFKESECNSNVENEPCMSFDDFMLSQDAANSEVKIACGMCVSLDKTTGSVIDMPHGLNIVGKLHIPNTASFKLRTKYILVQGVFRVDPPPLGSTLPRATGEKIIFQLMGNESVSFFPDMETDNGMSCGMEMDMVTRKACNVGIKPFAIAGGRLDINAIADTCPSWTKLKSLSNDKTQITLSDPQAAACYGVGAELLFTSEDVAAPFAYQLATVASIEGEVITLTAPLPRKMTSIEDDYGDMYAVEVALMDRYITFEPTESPDLIGGHTIILHSPHIAQNVRGVEFRKFGQQGNLGRYPFHMHLSESVYGSFIYKNLVRDSNQRCYVIHGTHNVTLQENVAFDTFGHCYMLEDGGEWDNHFIRNLGVATKRPDKIIRPEESDRVTTTTFWMTTMTNHYVGNVAAGSDNIGFWFEATFREPSRSLPANQGITSTRSLPIGTFDNNVAHSNKGSGFATYPSGYFPNGRETINNFDSYKNGGHGAFFAQSRNITLNTGVFSDNKGGMMMKGNTRYIIQNVTVVGVSDNVKTILAESRNTDRRTNHCSYNKNIEGVGFRVNGGIGGGAKFVNMTFKGFTSNDECEESSAIVAERVNVRHGLMDCEHSYEDILFDSTTNRVSFCRVMEPGLAQNGGDIGNVGLSDVKGTISPDGRPGFYLESDDPVADNFLGGCEPLVDGCAQFCPDACLRLVEVQVAGSSYHEDTLMKVTDRSTGKSVLRSRHIISKTEMPSVNARYGVRLPASEAGYDVTFVTAEGAATWPGYAYMTLEATPDCTNPLSESDISLDYPVPTHRCDNAIFNGDFEYNSTYGWQERTNYRDGIVTVSPGAGGTNFALRTTQRTSDFDGGGGLFNRIDISCLKYWAGDFLRLQGKIRLQDANGVDVACDADCPEVKLRLDSEVLISKRVATSSDGTWSTIDEMFVVPASIASKSVAEIVLDKAYNHEFVIDEWTLDYLGTKTYAPSVSPTPSPTQEPEPTTSPTDSPTSDGICPKYTNGGWTSGTFVANLAAETSPNGFEWQWNECARECYLNEDCEFWTLRLNGDKSCLLRKNPITYNEGTGHIEGPSDSDCLEEPSHPNAQPTFKPTTSTSPSQLTDSPTTDGVCTKYDSSGYHAGNIVDYLLPSQSNNGEYWEWQECGKMCAERVECEFWTLRMTGDGACLLNKNQGYYYSGGNHMEGDKDADCLGFNPPTFEPTSAPVESPETDGVCSKWDHSGWTSGTKIANHPASASPNGIEWHWKECAQMCSLNADCEFWTLRLAGNKNCMLSKNIGTYNGGSNHMEGPKDLDCMTESFA